MPTFQRILATSSLCLAAMGLNSCIYSDLGRTIGSISTQVPRLVPKADRGMMSSYCGNLYCKEGRYYVALPLAWVPERRRGYEYFPLFTPNDSNPFTNFLTYNRPYTAEELQQYPTTPEYFEAVNPRIVPFPQPDSNGAVGYVRAELTPAKHFDPRGAELLGLYGVAGAAHRIEHLDKRHAWYYYPLMPLQAVATVSDIALSSVLMPLSFPVFWVDEITGTRSQFISPWFDYTHPTFQGPLYPEYDTGISPPKTMAGKCLVLGDKRFDFHSDYNGIGYFRGKRYSCQYKGSLTQAYPLAKLSENLPKADIGRRWELFFITPTSGVAVCLPHDKNIVLHMKGKLPPLKPGDMICHPFRIENLAK